MTVRDLLENALIGAVSMNNQTELDQIKDLLRRWKSEYDTDVELISFAQAFPDDEMLITDPDLPF